MQGTSKFTVFTERSLEPDELERIKRKLGEVGLDDVELSNDHSRNAVTVSSHRDLFSAKDTILRVFDSALTVGRTLEKSIIELPLFPGFEWDVQTGLFRSSHGDLDGHAKLFFEKDPQDRNFLVAQSIATHFRDYQNSWKKAITEQLYSEFRYRCDLNPSVQEFMFDLILVQIVVWAPDYVNVLYRTSDKFESVDIGVCFSNLDGSCDCQIY